MPTHRLRQQHVLGYHRPHLLRMQGHELGMISDDTKSLWFWVAAYRGFAGVGVTASDAFFTVLTAYNQYTIGVEAVDSILETLDPKVPHVTH